MQTLHLKFADRTTTLAVLGSTLGFASMAETPGAREPVTAGHYGTTRYDLCFLGDLGLTDLEEAEAAGADLVNLLWWGEGAGLDDLLSAGLSAYVVEPLTPTCVFAP